MLVSLTKLLLFIQEQQVCSGRRGAHLASRIPFVQGLTQPVFVSADCEAAEVRRKCMASALFLLYVPV